MSARLSGIMSRMPMIPPTTAITAVFPTVRSYPMSRIAGSVKTMPAAIDSPAEPVVCTMLFSRIVERPRVRKKATERTAMGIEAETVRPILSARYTLDAAKTIPSSAPRSTARNVISAGLWLAGTKG
jgi:hypothetical protein